MFLGFTLFINKDKVDIFTLNHGILLEHLFKLNNIKYSRGFSTSHSNLRHDKSKINVFNADFNKNINIYKLHGSIDYYKYPHYSKNDYAWSSTGEYTIFSTMDYYERHRALRVNETDQVIQDFVPTMVPCFISGTNKRFVISNNRMYAEMFRQFESIIS